MMPFYKLLLSVCLLCITFALSGQKFNLDNTEEGVLYEVECASNVMYIVKKDNKLSLIDTEHNPLVTTHYDFFKILSRGMLYAKTNAQPVLINCEGKVITSDQYKEITVFYNNDLINRYFVMSHYGKIGLINEEGKELIPPIYDSLDPMSQHKYIYAQRAGGKEFFDYDGKPISFDNLKKYSSQ